MGDTLLERVAHSTGVVAQQLYRVAELQVLGKLDDADPRMPSTNLNGAA